MAPKNNNQITLENVENQINHRDEEKKLTNVDFETALDYTGFGKYTILFTITCGIGLMTANTEAYSLGYVLPLMACDFKLSTSEKGLLTSANFIGLVGSSLFWGLLADRRGRKGILIGCFFASFVTSLAAGFMGDLWGIIIMRFLNGVVISAPSCILYAYFGECQNQKKRAKYMAFMSLFIGIALILVPGMGWGVTAAKLHFTLFTIEMNSWRIYFVINSLASLLSALVLLKCPESPKYLYDTGRAAEALQILKWIYRINSGKSEDSFPVKSLEEKKFFQADEKKEISFLMDLWNQLKPFFRKPYVTYILVGSYIQAALYAISSGLFLWYPDIRNQVANPETGNLTLTICQALSQPKKIVSEECTIDDDAFIQSLYIGGLYVVGYLSWGIVVKMLGNRMVFWICMSLSSICTLLLCFVSHELTITALFMVALVLPGICVSLVNAMLVDLFPANMLGITICCAMTLGRLGSVISSSVVGLMLEWSCVTTFVLYFVSLAANLLLSFLFPKKPPQTQDG